MKRQREPTAPRDSHERSGGRGRALRWAAAGVLAATVLVAAGTFRWSPDLSSLAVRTLRHSSLAESRAVFSFLRYFTRTMEHLERDPETGAYGLDHLELAGLDPFERGYVAFHRGEPAAAVRAFQRAVDERGESEEQLFWLALANLRLGEAVNCLMPAAPARDAGDPVHGFSSVASPCTLPVRDIHHDPGPSRRAMQLFTILLERHDPESAVYRWLLNFGAMTAGDFPDGVPAAHRLEPDFIQELYGTPREEVKRLAGRLRFVDRAPELGVDRLDTGRGVAVEDFDRDGDLDLVTGGTFEDVAYYRNDLRRTGRFTEATSEVGLAGVLQPLLLSAADYDGDGWVDLLVGRPFARFALFRNEGGRFREVTEESGLLGPGDGERLANTWRIAWGDVDRDGDLDLFLAQWGVRWPSSSPLLSRRRMRSRLYLNEGGRFVDRTAAFGLDRVVRGAFFVGAAFGDLDADGYPELMLSSWLRGGSVLLRNVAGRRFVGWPLPGDGAPGFMTAFVDVDHDGRLDLFQGGFAVAATSLPQVLERRAREGAGASRILMQTPDGRLDPRTGYFGSLPLSTMGASYGDLDNDGCLDFYLGTGTPEPWYLVPNLLFLGRRDGWECRGDAVNASMLPGFGTVQKGHGIVFFDVDGDGDQDVYSALGGMWPGERWPNQLFVNESPGGHAWVKLRLRGRETNRHGVGAMIRVVAVSPGGEAVVRTYGMDDKTGFGSAPYLAHIGLGPAVAIDHVEVLWPVSRCRATYAVELGEPGAPPEVLDEAVCRDEPGSSDRLPG